MATNAPDPGSDDALDALLQQLKEQPAEPRPFFYARFRAHLEALEAAPPESASALPGWLRRPAYAAVLGLLVLALNVGAAVRYGRQLREEPAGTEAHYDDFVTDYQLDPFALPNE